MTHHEEVNRLQSQVKALLSDRKLQNNPPPVTVKRPCRDSCTTRVQSKTNNQTIRSGPLNCILHIDTEKRLATVEPNVTMEQLVQATQELGLTVPVVPEFKSMTIGGAIMGIAGESTSHRWGGFDDICSSFEILCGNGEVMQVSPIENPEIFYGIAGSYGSLGMLLSAEVQLIPTSDFVQLRIHVFSKVEEALKAMQGLVSAKTSDFIEGIIFRSDLAVIIEGDRSSESQLPLYSLGKSDSDWFYQHVHKVALQQTYYEEQMPYFDYLFRHDQGAFWMGSYLAQSSLFMRFIAEGILKLYVSPQDHLSDQEIQRLHAAPFRSCPAFLYPWTSYKILNKLFHKAEKWFQNRFVIQDFCIPETATLQFLEKVMHDPSIFPIWLCPVKGTRTAQIMAPHLLVDDNSGNHFINVGLYGVPSYSAPLEQITRELEQCCKNLGGRKVLYSRSYYTEEEFWEIYSREAYDALRAKMGAAGFWPDIAAKVLG